AGSGRQRLRLRCATCRADHKLAVRQRTDACKMATLVVLDRVVGSARGQTTRQGVEIGHDLRRIGDLAIGEAISQRTWRLWKGRSEQSHGKEKRCDGKTQI